MTYYFLLIDKYSNILIDNAITLFNIAYPLSSRFNMHLSIINYFDKLILLLMSCMDIPNIPNIPGILSNITRILPNIARILPNIARILPSISKYCCDYFKEYLNIAVYCQNIANYFHILRFWFRQIPEYSGLFSEIIVFTKRYVEIAINRILYWIIKHRYWVIRHWHSKVLLPPNWNIYD